MTLVKNFFFVLDQAFCRTSVSCLIGFSLWKCVFEYWKTIYVDIPSLVELSNNPGPLARSLSLSVQQRDPLASSAISPPFPGVFRLRLLGKSERSHSYVFGWLLARLYQRERKRYEVSNECRRIRRVKKPHESDVSSCRTDVAFQYEVIIGYYILLLRT